MKKDNNSIELDEGDNKQDESPNTIVDSNTIVDTDSIVDSNNNADFIVESPIPNTDSKDNVDSNTIVDSNNNKNKNKSKNTQFRGLLQLIEEQMDALTIANISTNTGVIGLIVIDYVGETKDADFTQVLTKEEYLAFAKYINYRIQVGCTDRVVRFVEAMLSEHGFFYMLNECLFRRLFQEYLNNPLVINTLKTCCDNSGVYDPFFIKKEIHNYCLEFDSLYENFIDSIKYFMEKYNIKSNVRITNQKVEKFDEGGLLEMNDIRTMVVKDYRKYKKESKVSRDAFLINADGVGNLSGIDNPNESKKKN